MNKQELKKEMKKNMLQDLYDMEEKVKSGEVTDLIIAASGEATQIFKQAAHPLTGLGLAHFAVMKMEDQQKAIESNNDAFDLYNVLKHMMNN